MFTVVIGPAYLVPLQRMEPGLALALLGGTVAVLSISLLGLFAWRLAALRKEFLHKGHKLCLGPDRIWLLDDRGGEETLWSLSLQRELRFSPIFSGSARGKTTDHFLTLSDEHGERRIDFLVFPANETRPVKRRISEWQARGATISFVPN